MWARIWEFDVDKEEVTVTFSVCVTLFVVCLGKLLWF